MELQTNKGRLKMKTHQMTSPNSGRPVANQFIIYDAIGNKYFQSYNSVIAKIASNGQIFLDKNFWDYSTTTGKYRNKFLGECIADTRKKIKVGEYVLVDLNAEMEAHQEQQLKSKFFQKWKDEEAAKEQAFRDERLAERRRLNGFRD
tara:strand:+ start:641 stop:1081 length:441 start_codon:yes stop_codon:yes gene_type:complete